MAATITAPAPSDLNTTVLAFGFVEQLAKELSSARVELPAFPDVVRTLLAAENNPVVDPDKIVHVINSEPGLKARVMAIANSAAFNGNGKPVTDLKTAVDCIGANIVRTAALSFAIEQLRFAPVHKSIAKNLEELWHESTKVAALCHAVATRVTGVNPDDATLSGLMHNVGKVYILARAHRHITLFSVKAALHPLMTSWNANVGKAILENWGFPQQIAEAVGAHEDLARHHDDAPDLTDVLTVATAMSAFLGKTQELELNMHGVPAFQRLKLDNEMCFHIMEKCAGEIAALRTALGD